MAVYGAEGGGVGGGSEGDGGLKFDATKAPVRQAQSKYNIFCDYIEFFITVSVDMGRAIRCHRQDMKTSIINGSEVFRLSVRFKWKPCENLKITIVH